MALTLVAVPTLSFGGFGVAAPKKGKPVGVAYGARTRPRPVYAPLLSSIPIADARAHAANAAHAHHECARAQRKLLHSPACVTLRTGLPGNLGPAGDFDPAGFLEGKSELEVYRYREAELTHGRVSMLASLGFLVQEKFHPLFSGDGGPAIDQIPQLPVWLWVVMTGAIGAAEAFRIQTGFRELDGAKAKAETALRPGYYPGDLGFDPLGLQPQSKTELLAMQTKELNNGRLAMIATTGMVVQELVTGAKLF
jgi:hypothetical protein